MVGQFFLFALDGRRYAIHLAAVERVIPVIEITPVPEAPGGLLGIVNLQGRIVPVIDIRGQFSLPERGPELDDSIVVARAGKWTLCFVVDEVEGVVERFAGDVVGAAEIMPGLDTIEGVVKVDDGDLSIIYDLGRALSFAEEGFLLAMGIEG